MALVTDSAWAMTISFRDRNKNPATVTAYYPGTESAANVQGYLTGTLIPAIQGLTNALITKWSYSFGAKETDPAVLNAPDLGSQVERKASFTFLDAGSGYMNIEVPSIKPELVIEGTNTIDPLNASVAAFVDAIVDSGLADLNGAVNFRGLSLTKLNSVKQIHRRNSKG